MKIKKHKRKAAAVQTVRLHPKTEKLIARTVAHALKTMNVIPPEFRSAAQPSSRPADTPRQSLPRLPSAVPFPLPVVQAEPLPGISLLQQNGPPAAPAEPPVPQHRLPGIDGALPQELPQELPPQPAPAAVTLPAEPLPSSAALQVQSQPMAQGAGAVDYKTKRVLLVAPLQSEELWPVEQMIAEQLRHLVHEVISLKAYPGFAAALEQFQPDLLLLIGSAGDFTDSDLERVRCGNAVRAIWMSDGESTDESALRLAAMFPYVFTQNVQYIPFYRHPGCRQVSCLPFAADRTRFYPMAVEEEFRSEILLLGDNRPHGRDYVDTIRHVFGFREGMVSGTGWEAYPELTVLPPETDLQKYYNGAGIIIHWGQPASVLYDIAACGAFQLAEAHPNIYEYMHPGEDVIPFHTAQELLEKLHVYSTDPERKRAVASRALWRSTYDYSCLQMALKLLYTVFHR
ncbi:glycosyltransferase family protein [Paenibacillus tepidiphilus]|uniref:glycosyltransferase family protein n=1 Tax=Paenibacillus tepidiphilus TaxID=2608683 RepID=UPI0013A561AC|nr:glycosyltransferase [Paenibacillus tepidiphilus]